MIRYDQMIGLYKRNTAKVFPNAIEVVTLQHKYFFSSFMFRDAAFRLASTAWMDYLEASPSSDTHRINTNSKMDLELFVRKPTGDEQVKMMDDIEDESVGSESSVGSSPPTESSIPSRKLGDSGKSGTSATPSSSFSNLPLMDSEDANDEVDKKKRRKSSSKKKHDAITSSNAKELEDSQDDGGGKRTEASPTQHRHSISHSKTGSDATVKARNVGFDLSKPPANPSGDSSVSGAEKPSDGENPAGQGSDGKDEKGKEKEKEKDKDKDGGSKDKDSGTPPPGDGNSSSSGGGGGGSAPDIPVPIPTQQSCKHIVEEADDKKFSGTKLGNRTYKNITLEKFFAIVFCNEEYDQGLVSQFEYTEWNCPTWAATEGGCCINRLVSYRMPLNASLGPKSTRQDSFQYARYKNDRTLLFESCNISKDVPMSDAFEVHEKWVITQDGPNVNVDVVAGLIWKKSAWGLKGTITQKSIEGVTENWEFVNKHIETTLSKFSGGGGAASSSGGSSPAMQAKSSKKKFVEEEDSSSEDEKPRRPRRRMSRKGSKDAGSSLDRDVAIDSGAGGPGVLAGWRGIAFVAIAVMASLTLGALLINVLSISARMQSLESSRHWAASNYEEHNLRERVAFLEHITTALLQNVSDPGSYKTEQQKYFTALRELDSFLGKTKESVGTLQQSVHRLHQRRESPLTTIQIVEALKTLPIDRKVLGYLTNPESFAQQLASVIELDPSSHNPHAAAPVESSWWYLYLSIILCLITLIVIGAGKGLGMF